MAGSPGVIPKAALTTSRIVYKPFLIPQKLTDSSYLVGQAAHNAIGKSAMAIGESYAALQPRGPAKWLLPLLGATTPDGKFDPAGGRIVQSVAKSSQMADRNKNVFWDPVSQGSESIGRAIAGPGAYYYAKRAGFPDPSNPDVIKGLLNLKLFQYPVPAPPPPAPDPGSGAAPPADAAAGQAAAEQAAAQQAAAQAADGAGQAQQGQPAA